MIVIPAWVVLLNTIGEIWHLPYITEITATISAIGVFLGAMLKISSKKYYDTTYDEEEMNSSEFETNEEWK